MWCLPAHPGTAPELPAQVGDLAGPSGRRWDWMRGSDHFLFQEGLMQVSPSLPWPGAFQPQQPLLVFDKLLHKRSLRVSASCAPSSLSLKQACALQQS